MFSLTIVSHQSPISTNAAHIYTGCYMLAPSVSYYSSDRGSNLDTGNPSLLSHSHLFMFVMLGEGFGPCRLCFQVFGRLFWRVDSYFRPYKVIKYKVLLSINFSYFTRI